MSNTCFACHGPDEEDNPSEFRIDSLDAASAPLPSDEELVGIKPGDPDASEVYLRITGQSDGEQMPPEEFQHHLTEYDKALFKKWIEQGAEYQQHWSYTPLVRPATPELAKHDGLVENAIDNFILARLESEGVEPSSKAGRARLLRRLSLDLIGLPPSVEDVEQFLADSSRDAYEKQVDRLLASKHFGERMATQWLDVVRFADSVGFHGDQNQRVFPYRDYIINSLNENKPFDQFTREQLAADLMPNATPEQLAATGLVRLNMMTREGGAQPEEYLAKYASDRVRMVGTAWLGSTTGCCECHNHKFDPFSIKDFYSLGAFFDDVRQWGVYADYGYTPNADLRGFNNDYPFPPELRFKSENVVSHIRSLEQKLEAEIAPRVTAQQRQTPEFREWCDRASDLVSSYPDGWKPVSPIEVSSSENTASEVLTDGSVLFSGKRNREKHKLVIEPSGTAPIAAIRFEVMPDDSHGGYVGRSEDGRFNIEMPLQIRRVSTEPVVEKPTAEPLEARYVRIELPNEYLSLAEVEVYAKDDSGKLQNVASRGAATQSSNYGSYTADRAIDGNTDGSGGPKSFTHTQRQSNNWWELDLKQVRRIEKIAVWNRQDFSSRLENCRVKLLDGDRKPIWEGRPSLPSPVVEIEPHIEGSLQDDLIEIAWTIADRFAPGSYREGHQPLFLNGAWRSGPSVWQLPSDEAKLTHTAVVALKRPLELKPGEKLEVAFHSADAGRVRLATTPFVRLAAGMPAANERLRNALLDSTAQEASTPIAAAYYLAQQPALDADEVVRGYRDAIGKLRSGYATTMVADAVSEDKRRQSRVLPRGDWQDKSGELVEPDTPHFLPKLDGVGDRRLTRLDLADWLTSRENPLTARHYVNRTWKHFFGTGLSARLDDLGNQGEWPSHPELLDWLAVDFMENGWDVKRLIKQMVMSHTYQQEAAVRGDLVEVDPYNRLLAQQAARRLEAEAIRDNALAIAGLLQTDVIGGPSVKPYQPSGYWRVLSFPGRAYNTSRQIEQYRRGVYVHWQRTFLHPMLANFDAPARDECTADRPVSNSPQQALTLLNDPSFVEASVAMADRLLNETEGMSDRERLDRAFIIALARSAKNEEADALIGLLKSQSEHFANAKADRDKLLNTGYFRPGPGLDEVRVAAWSQVCRVILNLHEVINRY